jgi:hypothetical protein
LIDSAFERYPTRTIADFGFVAPKNQVNDAAFSSACFTKDDDVRNGLLRNSIKLVTEAST